MRAAILVFLSPESWHIGGGYDSGADLVELEFSPETPVSKRVELAMEHCARLDADAALPVILAPSSQMCLVAQVAQDRAGRRGGRDEAMEYRLEEQVPISAEKMVAQWIDLPGDKALGICCQAETLAEVVSQMQLGDQVVQAICPSALLAGQRVSSRHDATDAAIVLGGLEEDSGWDLLVIHEGRLRGWQWFGDDREALKEALGEAAGSGSSPLKVVPVGVCDELVGEIGALANVDCQPSTEETTASAAMKMAWDYAEQRSVLWVDLRSHHRMPRRPNAPADRALRVTGVALTALLLCLVGSGLLLGRRYQDRAKELSNRQTQVFMDTMDTRNVPLDVLARLRSERMRLAGLGGPSGDEPDRPTSALAHLESLLSALPQDIRFRVTTLDIDPNRIIVAGHARDLLAVEKVTNAVRQVDGYVVQPGETQRLDDRSFSFTFRAEPVESTEGGQK